MNASFTAGNNAGDTRDGTPVTRKLQCGAIRAVHAGRKAISPEVSFQLAEHATDDALTAGEVRVLALIAEGRANKEIAKRLSISEATVKGQVQNILSKLGAKDRTHAAMIGLKRGIIQL